MIGQAALENIGRFGGSPGRVESAGTLGLGGQVDGQAADRRGQRVGQMIHFRLSAESQLPLRLLAPAQGPIRPPQPVAEAAVIGVPRRGLLKDLERALRLALAEPRLAGAGIAVRLVGLQLHDSPEGGQGSFEVPALEQGMAKALLSRSEVGMGLYDLSKLFERAPRVAALSQHQGAMEGPEPGVVAHRDRLLEGCPRLVPEPVGLVCQT